MRIIYTLLILGLFLSACNNDDEAGVAENDYFTYPEAVENNIISGEMYWQSRKFIEDINKYASVELKYKQSVLNMVGSTYNEDLINSYKNHLDERDITLSKLPLDAITEVDKMLANNIEKYIIHSQNSIIHMRKFTEEFDFSYFDLASIEIEMSQGYFDDFWEICESYDLFGEKS